MNKEITKKFGFDKEMKMAEQSLCPFCQTSIDPKTDLRDELSVKEYYISGLCQECQDKMFGE